MSSNTHKSAAVPFVNQKGERSMKRVKVERYVAGKRPAYAKEEDEDEEYYTTDDEEEYEEDEEEEEVRFNEESTSRFKSLGYSQDDDDDDESSSGDDKKTNEAEGTDLNKDTDTNKSDHAGARECDSDDDDDDDDDPRFRRLKQIERSSKTDAKQLIEAQQRTLQIQPKYEIKNVVLEEDDDEEEIRQRHAIARKRQLETPVKPKAITAATSSGRAGDESDDSDSEVAKQSRARRLDTEDLLKDLKLTGISRPVREKLKTEEEQEEEQRRLREMLDQAKQEANKTTEIYKKIQEDIKREDERIALAKGDIGAREMSSVNTDDEDDELAYEEWKLREIKRVLRDRSERMLAAKAR